MSGGAAFVPGFTGRRVPALDGLRGVAIALVVLYHYLDIGSSSALVNALRHASSWGWSGVDLFFVLSGFLITGILVDTREQPHYFRNFYARRSLRIFPVYFLTLALAFALLPAAREMDASPLWFWLYLSNWWMGAAGVWAPGGLAVFWSLAIEEQFYLAWAPLVRAVSRARLQRIAVFLVVAPLLLRVFLVATGWANPIAIHVFTVTRIDVLAIGACAALLVRHTRDRDALQRLGRLALAGGAAATLAVFVAQGSTRFDGWGVQTAGLSTIAVAYAGLLLLALAAPERARLVAALTSRPLLFLGKYSYAIYVFHTIVHHQLKATLVARPHWIRGLAEAGFPPWLALVLGSLVVTVGLAVASWHLVEKRCLAWKRHFER